MKSKIKFMGLLALVLIVGFAITSCGAFTRTDKIADYLLLARKVGRTNEGPLPLAVKINIDTEWDDLVNTINGAGVLVNLDLSGSTMTDTAFYPGKTGSDLILSLVLPNMATKIEGDFNVFSNLEKITFSSTIEIDETNPFVGCENLIFNLKGRGDLSVIEEGRALVKNGNELVAYPSAVGSITLNNINTIGRSAFNGTKITELNLPNTNTIGIRAFSGCTNLQSLNILAVKSIDENAFASTGNTALTITFGSNLETIAANLFEGVTSRKNVTLKVPEGEVENFNTMRDAFRGRGWSEGAFISAGGQNRVVVEYDWWGQRIERNVWTNFLNTNINITVEGY